jgi:hypothetical protein
LQKPNAALEILSGWKQIASHLGKGVRTVQRYERKLGLPIRRPAGKSTGSVIASKIELDAWVLASPLREAFRLPEHSASNATLLAEFRRNVQETHRLHEESAKLRAEVKASLDLVQGTLGAFWRTLQVADRHIFKSDDSSAGRPYQIADAKDDISCS